MRQSRIHTAAWLSCFVLGLTACNPIDETGRDPGIEDGGDAEFPSAVEQHAAKDVCSGGTFRCQAMVRVDATGAIEARSALKITPDLLPAGYGPADLASAYNLGPTASAGGGQTIAIVVAYNYPNAASDLATYRTQFGLPPCTVASGCFKVVNQNGQTSPLPGNSSSGDDWTVEAAVDLDMASAGCPTCKLVLVEANDDQGMGLFVANNGAASLGVTAISNSWGGPSDGSDSAEETYFNHPGVGIFFASGNNGSTGSMPEYPSTSAFVTAVGGTTLTKSTASARGWAESAWPGSGSSCSKLIAKPSYQTNAVCTKRAAADVSAIGDPNTGVAVYNVANGGWIVIGGTSASTPFVAGVFTRYGVGALGPSFSYAHTGDFFDVTTGSNGSCSGAMCKAGPGWDGPTGNGTPNGAGLAGGCTPQCTGKACGPDGCGGSCGACPTGDTCSAAGQCQTCVPQCAGKVCGPDGCGGTCGTCANGAPCNVSGQCGTGGTGTCEHEICSTGHALATGCDSCASEICAVDSYCCTTLWDAICVGEVGSVCGQSCTGSGGSTCSHDECSTGVKLKKACDPCVTKICKEDSFCCVTRWDGLCVSEVASICAETCQ